MRFFVDAWDPGYGTGAGLDEGTAESSARLVLDPEQPASDWAPIEVPTGVTGPDTVLFVDGVRRIDTNVTVVETGDGGPEHLGICASYAAGVVISTPTNAAVAEVSLRRGLFTTAPGADEVTTRAGAYPAHVVSPAPRQPVADALSLALQNQLGILELGSAALARGTLGGRARATAGDGSAVRGVHGHDGAGSGASSVLGHDGDDLLVIDGPVRARDHLPRTLGLIKSHRTRYLPQELDRVVGALLPGERSPVFSVGTTWDRFTWYLRLPASPGAPWKGIVRVECSSTLTAAAAVELAGVSQLTLPRFASPEHRDPRAPQNLTPIAGLERHLRHLLGDRELLVRALRATAA